MNVAVISCSIFAPPIIEEMASITKRKSKYSVVYDYYDEEGVRHQKWETWGTYAEAKRRKAEIEHKQTNNTFVKPSIKTVSELLYDFMNLYGVNAWALSTYDSKKGLIDNYINPIIGKAKIKDITPRFMDEYYLDDGGFDHCFGSLRR